MERRSNEESKEEKSDFEKDCAICLTIMVEPCLLPCNHRFCI